MSDDDSETTAAPGSVSDWSSKRLEVTYQEARSVLDAQQTRLQNTDEKALRTTRLTIIAAGVLISLIEVLGVTLSVPLAYLSALFLIVAFGTVLATYNRSNPYLGPNRKYITQLIVGEPEPEPHREQASSAAAWETTLLESFGYWIEQNNEDIEDTDLLLIISNTALFLGIVFAAIAIVL